MNKFKNFLGKTIQSVDDSCQNAATFYFTDGTSTVVFAECSSGNYALPFFIVEDDHD